MSRCSRENDSLDGVALGGQDGRVGAQRLRLLQTLGDQVADNDARPAVSGQLQVDQADGARADDDGVVAELDLALQAAVDAAGHGLAEARLRIADGIGDLEQAAVGGDAVLGEASAHLAAHQVLALVVRSALAVVADAADHSPAGHHAVAGSEVLHRVPNRQDLACPLVPGCVGAVTSAGAHAGVGPDIAGADAAGVDADEYLVVCLDGREANLLDPQVAFAVELCCSHSLVLVRHCGLLSGGDVWPRV